MKLTANSQDARILHALVSGRWVSAAEIDRRANVPRLNSRISELRKRNIQIEHRTVQGKERAPLRHQYRWVRKDTDPALPPFASPAIQRHPLDRDDVPRDKRNRLRIYIVDERGELLLMGTAATESKLGVEICRLARAGELSKACIGILDTFGKESTQGTWLIQPFETRVI